TVGRHERGRTDAALGEETAQLVDGVGTELAAAHQLPPLGGALGVETGFAHGPRSVSKRRSGSRLRRNGSRAIYVPGRTRSVLVRDVARREVDGEAAFDDAGDAAVDGAHAHPPPDQRRRALRLYGDAREREIGDLAFVALAGLELEPDVLGAFARHRSYGLVDAEITVNG